MSHKKLSVIFNPASAGGKTGKKLYNIKKLLNQYFTENYRLHVTTKPLDATVIARKALKEGYFEEDSEHNTSVKKSEMLAKIMGFSKRKIQRAKITLEE